jgi:hypothetical protein
MMFAKSDRPQPRPGIVEEPQGQGLLLYDTEVGAGHLLNSTATHIWRLVDGETSVEKMADHLVDVYGLSPEDAVSELGKVLETIRAAGLLVDS